MKIVDLAFYHSFLAMIALTIARGFSGLNKVLEVNQAFLTYLKPSNIFRALKASSNSFNEVQGVSLGMFKMDCLALFGKNVLGN